MRGRIGEGLRSVAARASREPLLHFLAIGSVLFAVHRPPVPTDPGRVIEVTPATVESLAARVAQSLGRPLSAAELDHVVEGWVRDEVLVREAMALGLDRDDTVIRQRLRQKMDRLAEGAAVGLAPTDDELREWYAARGGDFAGPATLSFEQVMIGDAAEAPGLLAALAGGAPSAEVGRASLLPESLRAVPADVVDRAFGPGFAEALAGLAVGAWDGPVASAYGLHLVRVLDREEAGVPPLDRVRDRVEAAWRREAAEGLREAQVEALMGRYEVLRTDGGG